MSLAISMLERIAIYSPCTLEHKTTTSSIPMCYAKYCNVHIFSLGKVTYIEG